MTEMHIATRRNLPTRRKILIDGVRKLHSHYVWHRNTGYWPADGEVIHHIDDNCGNNEFNNLALMTRSEHNRLHHIGRSRSKETRAKISAAMRGEKHPRWQGDDATPDAKYHRIWRARRRGSR